MGFWDGWQFIRTGKIKSETIKIRELLESQQKVAAAEKYWYDRGYYDGWYAREGWKKEIEE